MDSVAPMVHSEQIVYEWLLENRGMDEDDITRKAEDQTPDFFTPRGAYEAKLLYGDSLSNGKVIVTREQAHQLNEHNATVVVVSGETDSPIETFDWDEKDDTEVTVRGRWEGENMAQPPEVSEKAMAKVRLFQSQMAEEIGHKPTLKQTVEALFTSGIDDGKIPQNAHERVRDELDAPGTPFS